MDMSRQACRLCLTTTDFNISLFSSYCRKSNMLGKILVCLNLVVEETDQLTTICSRCANKVERFYGFIMFSKQSQTKLDTVTKSNQNFDNEATMHCHITSHMAMPNARRQVVDANYTFSFLDISKNEDQKEVETSTPFSYSSPKGLSKPSIEQCLWNTRARFNDIKKERNPEATKVKRIKNRKTEA